MTVQSSGATYQDILKLSLEQEGYTGALDDMLYSKLKAITSEEGTVQDLMMKYLASIGFDSGAVQDRLAKYLEFFGYTGTNPDMLLTAVKNGVFLDAPVFSSDLYLDYNRQLYTASSLTGQELLSFSPLHTFTRASDKTYFDQNGDLQVAGPNVPVFDYDPVTQKFTLSIHSTRTNIFLNSQAPVTQNVTVSAVSHTLSFYGTGEIVLSGAATGTLTGTGGSTERVTLTFTPTSGTLTITPVGTEENVQLEAGAFATPPIITGATSKIRNEDVVLINNINTSEWWNPSEGEIIVYWRANVSSSSAEVITISDGTTANRIGIRKDTSNNILIINTTAGATTVISSGAKLDGLNTTRLKYTPSGIVASSNGGAEVQINTAPPLSVLTRINLGSSATGTLLLNGNLDKLIYVQSAGA
jgi:hypothetical protein